MAITPDSPGPVPRTASGTVLADKDTDPDSTDARVDATALEAFSQDEKRSACDEDDASRVRKRSLSFHRRLTGAGAGKVTRSKSAPLLPQIASVSKGKFKSAKSKFSLQIYQFLKEAFAALELPELIKEEGLYREEDAEYPIDDLAKQIRRGKSLQDIFRELKLERNKTSAILITTLIKKVIREHTHSLIPYDLLISIFPEGTEGLESKALIENMQDLFSNLHPTRQTLFKELLEHLTKIAGEAEHNRMTSHNLAVTIATAIFDYPNRNNRDLSEDEIAEMRKNIQLVNHLLEECIDHTIERRGVSWLEPGDPKAEL